MKNTIICQNKDFDNPYCEKEFSVSSLEVLFYEKIKVPNPTFCPTCRSIRRFAWRNNRSLYSRVCGLCNKNLISMYKEDGTDVYCESCYSGDSWDMYQNQSTLDFSRPFFSQLKELFKKQPRVYSIRYGTNVNCDYSNSLVNSKNMYLSFSGVENEDLYYSENVDQSKNSFDCLACTGLDQCSYSIDSSKNYNSHFMSETENCVDSFFLYDCTNCSNCFMSSNLRNQSYYFRNQKVDKDTYNQKIKELCLEKYSSMRELEKEYDLLLKESVHRYTRMLSSENATGNAIFNSKNISRSFNIRDCEDVATSYRMGQSKDCMDCGWVLKGELEYETMTGSGGSYNQVACFMCLTSKDIQYSISCKNCSDCFGCVGLSNASYCILNTQYTKEEYFELLPKVKKHMVDMPYVDQAGRTFGYGEFFPYDMSLFGYNESIVNEFFPLSKVQVEHMNYNWYERPERMYTPTYTQKTVPNSILDVPETFFQEIILCPNNGDYKTQCTKAFKIHEEELRFLKQKGFPLPRYCPNCRHYTRSETKNSMVLYTRMCSNHCGNSFETSYEKNTAEKVFCDDCYKKALY